MQSLPQPTITLGFPLPPPLLLPQWAESKQTERRQAVQTFSETLDAIRAMSGVVATALNDILETFRVIARRIGEAISRAFGGSLPQRSFQRPRRPRRRSSRRAAVIDRRLAAGLTIDGKNPLWEAMGIRLTRSETRAFRAHIAKITRRYGPFSYLHVREFAPYVRACRRQDAKVARRMKYAVDCDEPYDIPLRETHYGMKQEGQRKWH